MDVVNNRGYVIRVAVLVLAIVGFALPYFTAYGASASGFNMAFSTGGAGTVEARSLTALILTVGALCLGLIALSKGPSGRFFSLASGCAALGGFIALVVFWIDFARAMQVFGSANVYLSFGFWLTFLCLLVAVVLTVLVAVKEFPGLRASTNSPAWQAPPVMSQPPQMPQMVSSTTRWSDSQSAKPAYPAPSPAGAPMTPVPIVDIGKASGGLVAPTPVAAREETVVPLPAMAPTFVTPPVTQGLVAPPPAVETPPVPVVQSTPLPARPSADPFAEVTQALMRGGAFSGTIEPEAAPEELTSPLSESTAPQEAPSPRSEAGPLVEAHAESATTPKSLTRTEGAGRPGEKWILPQGRDLHIGRGDSCWVQLTDGKSSREHALLSYRADGLYVTDLGSANGTKLNKIRLGSEPQRLVIGDKLQVGDTVLEAGGSS